jgi:hypothetical protein
MRHADAVEEDQRWTITHIFVVPARLVVRTEKTTTAIWSLDALCHKEFDQLICSALFFLDEQSE